jgi:radical SAM superfamily enzyme YgiQ (UPF0313 family)
MIIIMNPPFPNKKSAHYQLFEKNKYPNPALTIFAGLFHKKGIPYLCIDAKLDSLTYHDVLSLIEEKLKGSIPTMLGITNSNTTLIQYDMEFMNQLKNKYPAVPLVIGGPHASALPEQTLQECKGIDVVCKFEGTETILELYDFYTSQRSVNNLADIKGIVYRDNTSDTIKTNPHRDKKIDMLQVGRPRWEDFSKGDIYHIFTAIGCPYQCSYCFNMTNRRFSIKPIDYVIEELNVLISRNGMKHFFFSDGTFGADKKNTKELLQRMIDEGIAEKVTWECTTRVDVLEEELIGLMKKAGCLNIALGMESGSNKILERAHKKTNIEQIYKAVDLVKKYGIVCKCFIIFGHIGETKEDIKETIKLTVKLNPDEIVVGVMTPWPGTEVYDLAVKKEEGLELLTNDYKLYDKWFGESMLNRNISLKELNSLRNEIYLRLFLQNHRYKDFLSFIWENRKPISRKVLSLFMFNLSRKEI